MFGRLVIIATSTLIPCSGLRGVSIFQQIYTGCPKKPNTIEITYC